MPVLKDRRFRDMSLTEEEVEALIHANAELCERKMRWDVDHFGVGEELDNTELVTFVARARRLLPLWRQWAIERERLWFALIGLGLDIEGDSLADMTSREMLERLERSMVPRSQLDFVLSELDR